MKVEISIGEAIDKLSILEIKLKKITDENKKIEIQKEIDSLQECQQYKNYYLFYRLLMHVNEKIWDMTDVIKNITIEDSNYFAYLSNQIFEFNQKRFRIKKWYNLNANSNIKEQKSYAVSQCKIFINDINTLYDKIPEIIFLTLEYDSITIISMFNNKINNIFKNIPTIIYLEHDNINISNYVFLEKFEIPNKITELNNIYEFKPITYISGGLLGDFIHQLSIINEIFLLTGQKGILYIANDIGGDNFRYELSKTYSDTYKLIFEQKYIKEYKIFNNEHYDINLSSWRQTNLERTWDKIFYDKYRVNWGINKWLNVPYDNKWKDTILFNTNSYRHPYNIDFVTLFEKYGKYIKFIKLNSNNEYDIFKNTCTTDVESYTPSDLYELCIAINSCKLFIGNLSSPLAFAYALHKQSVVGLCHSDQIRQIGLEKIIPNLILNTDFNVVMKKIDLLFYTF